MDFGFWTGLLRFLLLWTTTKSTFIPDGVYHTECSDRYFMLAVDLSFAGQKPYIEAVDRTGAFPITEHHAAQCGYTVSVLPVPAILELRASYFSCHTANKNDKLFTFNFNLIVKRDGKNIPFGFNKTCSPSLAWSPREVTCEVNYLEVSVKSDLVCPLGPKPNSWDAAVQTVYGSATYGWQVVFEKEGKETTPMNLSETHLKGYTIDGTEERVVFRAAYGQPHSFSTVIDGIPVEVVHAVLFSRQNWFLILIDLLAACTMYDSLYDYGGFMIWETPDVLYPGLQSKNFSFGLNGNFWEPTVAEKKGYNVKNLNTRIQIGIPYNAEGAHRKSFISGDLYDLYTYNFNMEQISADKENAETRIRFHRKLTSPLLKRSIFTENRTVPDEHMFTVHLGNVPEDVKLVALQLNDKEIKAPFINSSTYNLVIDNLNHTYGYTLKVPFDDPSVIKRFSLENAAMEHKLNIVYTLTVRPKSEPYFHWASVTVLTSVSPPQFEASCSETGISFKLDHRPSDFLWDFTVGSDPLTSELAAKQGYIMSNNSQTLQLDVPLFTHGYKYENISLKGFFGTFETLVRDHKTAEVQSSTVKRCLFAAKELVVCSPDGKITVVADLSEAVAYGGSPVKTTLLDKYCGPIETDDTRALFSFPLNSCGTSVKLNKENVIYENEILFSKNSTIHTGSVPFQCTYPLAGLYRLFSVYKFESETAGIGHLTHSPNFTTGLESPTVNPTSTLAVAWHTIKATEKHPAYRPLGHYVKMQRYFKSVPKKRESGIRRLSATI